MRSLIFLSLLATSFSQAQITLTIDDFADGGDTVRMSRAVDPAIDFSTTGSNVIWDFSSLVAESQVLREFRDMSEASALVNFMFGGFAPLDYRATSFVESDALSLEQISVFLPVTISELNQMSRNTADSITSVGASMVVSGIEVPFRSDTIETRYKFPIDYLNTWTSRGYSNIDINPIFDAIWKQYRTRNSEVDGWGSISTPFGTFDVLRIHHLIDEIDSIYIGTIGNWIGLPIFQSHIYEWWTTNELEPVLRITTNDVTGAEIVAAIEYRDIDLGLDASIAENALNLTLYPNPATNQLKMEEAVAGDVYTIIDRFGKQVDSGIVETSGELSVNLKELPKGNYTFLLLRDENASTYSFVKK